MEKKHNNFLAKQLSNPKIVTMNEWKMFNRYCIFDKCRLKIMEIKTVYWHGRHATADPNSSTYPVQLQRMIGPFGFMFLKRLTNSTSALSTPFWAADCSGDGLMRSLMRRSCSGDWASGSKRSCPFGNFTVGAPDSDSLRETGLPATAKSLTVSQWFSSNLSCATTILPDPNLRLFDLLMLLLSRSNLNGEQGDGRSGG